MSIHEGHRQRLKDRFRKEGLDGFDDLYVLELLLFYCVPRRDTNPIAHRLLDRFGSVAGVLDAPAGDLKNVEDVGESVITFLSLIKSVWRRYETQKKETDHPLRDIEECGAYIRPYFIGRSNESVYLLCLDAKSKVICCTLVGEGSVNSASVSVRKIVETALNANATSVILAHNHPSGLAIPSFEDVQTTKRIGKALQAVEVILVDHLVFADGDFTSLTQSGQYSYREINHY